MRIDLYISKLFLGRSNHWKAFAKPWFGKLWEDCDHEKHEIDRKQEIIVGGNKEDTSGKWNRNTSAVYRDCKDLLCFDKRNLPRKPGKWDWMFQILQRFQKTCKFIIKNIREGDTFCWYYGGGW